MAALTPIRKPTTRRGTTSLLPEYTVWVNMRQRCCNPKNPSYPRYGGRGVTVCETWLASFDAFFADMGPRPSALHSIERADNDQGYAPGNCVWAIAKQQSRNTRTNHLVEVEGGRTITVAEACEMVGLDPNTAYQRIHQGWSAEGAVGTSTIPNGHRGSSNHRRPG